MLIAKLLAWKLPSWVVERRSFSLTPRPRIGRRLHPVKAGATMLRQVSTTAWGIELWALSPGIFEVRYLSEKPWVGNNNVDKRLIINGEELMSHTYQCINQDERSQASLKKNGARL